MVSKSVQSMELSVAPGLFVLRYLSCADLRDAPSADVRSLGAAGDVDIISVPGSPTGHLPGPGSNLVIVARRASKVEVLVTARDGSSSRDARFTLDLLGSAKSEQVRPAVQTASNDIGRSSDVSPSIPSLAVEAHVARRGDVSADAEGWIGGPRSPSALEGVVFRSGGADLGIAAQFINTQDPGRWSAWVTPGSLVGTKQKASPLTALRLKLVGSDAPRFELSTEALFLGAPVSVQRGNEVEIGTLGAGDVLVGLRVQVVQRQSEMAEAAERRAPRVRVFR